MAYASDYQQVRGTNLGQNWQILAELGVQLPSSRSGVVLHKPKPKTKSASKSSVKYATRSSSVKHKTYSDDEEWEPDNHSTFCVRLRARPVDKKETDTLKDKINFHKCLEDPNLRQPDKPCDHRPNVYGKVNGIYVGSWWLTRLDCNYDGIHRPTVAGIHGGPDGAYSVAISGGYEDDIDLGVSFTYTGEGGRDLKGTVNNPKNLRTAPQSKDQALVKGNLALSKSAETGNPVRVIRGYKLDNEFAPEIGYRYDGLYTVKKYWETVGKAGFKVFKFSFVRCDDEPVPWSIIDKENDDHSTAEESFPQQDLDTPSDNITSSIKTRSFSKRKEQTTQTLSEDGMMESDASLSPKSVNNQSFHDTPSKNFSKTMIVELSPGVKSPVIVSKDLEEMKGCCVKLHDYNISADKSSNEVFISPKKDVRKEYSSEVLLDKGWLGWDEQKESTGNCLTVQYGQISLKVHLIGELWEELPASQCVQRSVPGNQQRHHTALNHSPINSTSKLDDCGQSNLCEEEKFYLEEAIPYQIKVDHVCSDMLGEGVNMMPTVPSTGDKDSGLPLSSPGSLHQFKQACLL